MSSYSSAGYKLINQDDYRHNYKNMYKSAHCVRTEQPNEPEYQKNYENCPQHDLSPYKLNFEIFF